MTDPAFLVSLHLVRSVLGEMKGPSTQLQAKAVRATAEVERVIERLSEWRSDDSDLKYSESFAAAVQMYGDKIPMPRVNKRQSHRNNVPADNAFDYYKLPAAGPDSRRFALMIFGVVKGGNACCPAAACALQ